MIRAGAAAAALALCVMLGWGNNPAGDIQVTPSGGGAGNSNYPVSGTINNTEPSPASVRYFENPNALLLAGAGESTAIYTRVTPGGANYYGIYGEVTNQADTHGGFCKVVHAGSGDAYYTALRGANGIGMESASYRDGTRGFIATLQRDQNGSTTAFGNVVGFQSVWGDDGTGGATVPPNYGVFYASRSLGNTFLIHKQDPAKTGAADGRTEIRISEFDLSRDRFQLYNTGELRLQSPLGTTGQNYPASSPLRLVSSIYSAGSAADTSVKLSNDTGATGSTFNVGMGATGAEATLWSLSSRGEVVNGNMTVVQNANIVGALALNGATALGASTSLGWTGLGKLLSPANGQLRITNAADTAPTTLVSGIVIGSASAGASLVYDSAANAGLRSMSYNQAANAGLAATQLGFTNNNTNVLCGFAIGSGTETGMGFPSLTSVALRTNGALGLSIDSSQATTLYGTAKIQNAATIRAGSAATPNGVVTGNVGDIFMSTAGGAATTLWVKESGAGTNSGWIGK